MQTRSGSRASRRPSRRPRPGPPRSTPAAASASSTSTRRASASVLDGRQAGRPRGAPRASARAAGRSRSLRRRSGATTTWRFGSVPSLEVTTSCRSARCTWTIFRSTAVIGSSGTGRPLCTASRRSPVGHALERRRGAGRDTRLRRRRPPCAPRSAPRQRTALARYWIASIVWPRLPITRPSSAPVSVAEMASSSSVISIRHGAPSAAQTLLEELAELRGRRARLLAAAVGGLRRSPRRPCAMTRAGTRPTPRSPRSPSERTVNRTAGLVEPGEPALELAQRRPLRLADGLALALDDAVVPPFWLSGSVTGAPCGPFFLRRRTRCWPLPAGFAARLGSPSARPRLGSGSGAAFGGVRDVRFGGGGGFGHEAARHEALADRPQVGRRPVEHQPDREVDDEGDEDERQRRGRCSAGAGRSSAWRRPRQAGSPRRRRAAASPTSASSSVLGDVRDDPEPAEVGVRVVAGRPPSRSPAARRRAR